MFKSIYNNQILITSLHRNLRYPFRLLNPYLLESTCSSHPNQLVFRTHFDFCSIPDQPSSITKIDGRPITQPVFLRGDDNFRSVFNTPNAFYRDNSMYIKLIEETNAKALVSLRSRRFGKSLFANMLSEYYDINNSKSEDFDRLFGQLYIGKNKTPEAHSYLVLNLNFSKLNTTSFEIFNMELDEYLNSKMKRFIRKYKNYINASILDIINENSALDSFQKLLDFIQENNQRLYVIIDEYDHSLNQALSNINLVEKFTYNENQNQLKKIESVFQTFFSSLKDSCGPYNNKVFITGITPIVLNQFNSGFNIALDISQDEDFAGIYGLTEDDVRNGLKRITPKLSPEVIDAIVKKWGQKDNGYIFNPELKNGLFCSNSIIEGLFQIQKKLSKLDTDKEELSNEELLTLLYIHSEQPQSMIDELLNKPSKQATISEIVVKLLRYADPSPKYSQNTLSLVSDHQLARRVIDEALQKDHQFQIDEQVNSKLSISHIQDIYKSEKALLDFMFYTGALTYVPFEKTKYESQTYKLRIPNETARKEFMNAVLE